MREALRVEGANKVKVRVRVRERERERGLEDEEEDTKKKAPRFFSPYDIDR
jgi:hypothetical protein